MPRHRGKNCTKRKKAFEQGQEHGAESHAPIGRRFTVIPDVILCVIGLVTRKETTKATISSLSLYPSKHILGLPAIALAARHRNQPLAIRKGLVGHRDASPGSGHEAHPVHEDEELRVAKGTLVRVSQSLGNLVGCVGLAVLQDLPQAPYLARPGGRLSFQLCDEPVVEIGEGFGLVAAAVFVGDLVGDPQGRQTHSSLFLSHPDVGFFRD
mmetsp:Transcript_13152/g.27829  ORF Transcript_13152/g.27829 Transcript_13152/m.27829 type:complete len:211 (+) Transcript_13152:46-678(+)